MACARIILFLAGCFVVANGRVSYNIFEAEKTGSCPPSLSNSDRPPTCRARCVSDGQCRGIEKCCPTDCGGTVCSVPITEKPGACPAAATGNWVCSSTCSSDDHCEGTKKCCENRCGAFACQRPEVGVKPFESSEVVEYELYNEI